MLRWRLLLGTLLIAALVGLCWLDAEIVPRLPGCAGLPNIFLMAVAVVVAVLATKEVLLLLAAANIRPVPWTVYLGNVWLVLSPWLAVVLNPAYERFFPRWGVFGSAGIWLFFADGAVPLVVAVLAVFLAEMRRFRKPGQGTIANLAGAVFGLMSVGLMLRFAVRLRFVGLGALASWLIVVKLGDTGAYTVGRLIGRRKMAPTISPGKTIEGALGALAFSCIGAWLAFQWLLPILPEPAPPFPLPPAYHVAEAWWQWLSFGLLVGAAGMLGDLAESLLKRDVGRKDSSDWLPGFGGVLDIIDSLLLSAPVAWFCWAAGIVG